MSKKYKIEILTKVIFSNFLPIKIYYSQLDYLKEYKTFEYFDGGKIKIVPLSLEDELLKNCFINQT